MPSLMNMAITIEQRGEACFHWVVLQAADDSAGQDVPLYHRIESSARPLRSHAEAVAAGRAVVPDSFTHGTSAQRQRWFYSGFKGGRVQDCDTFSAKQL